MTFSGRYNYYFKIKIISKILAYKNWIFESNFTIKTYNL